VVDVGAIAAGLYRRGDTAAIIGNRRDPYVAYLQSDLRIEVPHLLRADLGGKRDYEYQEGK
jgi:hypothetical protein